MRTGPDLIRRETEIPLVPNHVGVIPDGNRRAAQAMGASAVDGYACGAERFIMLLDWCLERGVRKLSAFASSTDNVAKRPTEELRAMHQGALLICNHIAHDPRIRLTLFGEIEALPDGLWREELLTYRQYQKDDTGTYVLDVYIGVNYSDELIPQSHGVPDLDLLIRTGGKSRLSGFLPRQCSQAQLLFLGCMWPEFSRPDFEKALAWYAEQEQTKGE
jgi:undecaprenyl diphosphate synthase